MDLLKFDKEFDTIEFKNKRRNLRVLKQTGTTNVVVDRTKKALLAGKRVSKTGNIYWETRKNRSDQKNSRV